VLQLAERHDELLTLDVETREKLKAARNHFNTLLQENMEAPPETLRKLAP